MNGFIRFGIDPYVRGVLIIAGKTRVANSLVCGDSRVRASVADPCRGPPAPVAVLPGNAVTAQGAHGQASACSIGVDVAVEALGGASDVGESSSSTVYADASACGGNELTVST